MDFLNKLVLKVKFGDDIRRLPVHNEDLTYDELIIMMQRIFKNCINNEDDLIMKYTDDEGDLVSIVDDSDLLFAIEGCRKLNLTITLKKDEVNKANKKCDVEALSISLKNDLILLKNAFDAVIVGIDYSKPSTTIEADDKAGTVVNRLVINGNMIKCNEFDPLQARSEEENIEKSVANTEIICRPPPVAQLELSVNEQKYENNAQVQQPFPAFASQHNMITSTDGNNQPFEVAPVAPTSVMHQFQPMMGQPSFSQNYNAGYVPGSFPPTALPAHQYQQQMTMQQMNDGNQSQSNDAAAVAPPPMNFPPRFPQFGGNRMGPVVTGAASMARPPPPAQHFRPPPMQNYFQPMPAARHQVVGPQQQQQQRMPNSGVAQNYNHQ